MNVDRLDRQAGLCFYAYRHAWGEEVKVFSGYPRSIYAEPCTRTGCTRRRIRVYTMRGNHVAGYDNEEKKGER